MARNETLYVTLCQLFYQSRESSAANPELIEKCQKIFREVILNS